MEIKSLVRENIQRMKPYSCARNEFKGEASVYLDANENPVNSLYNRYPDPLQEAVKKKLAIIKGVRPTQIMLGVGSDEPIDLIFRIFCEPKIDNALAIDPTYGMYQVCAEINDVPYRQVLLESDYSFLAEKMLAKVDEHTKVIFLCSPNNPTGNLLSSTEIEKLLTQFKGIVVIDEAYIDFATNESWLRQLDKYPNLIVLQTFSKAWGMAAVRCGMAYASEDIIHYFNKVKYPYNVNLLTQQIVGERLDHESEKNEVVKILLTQRDFLKSELEKLAIVEKVYPSDANFLLVKVGQADKIYQYLTSEGIIIRNRNKLSLCLDCLRITVGTEAENKVLIEALKAYTL